jgi:hypothetical protein
LWIREYIFGGIDFRDIFTGIYARYREINFEQKITIDCIPQYFRIYQAPSPGFSS